MGCCFNTGKSFYAGCNPLKLTLLLTSFSLGKMSRANPSACPLLRFPPFIMFPKARTKPSTRKTAWPDCRACWQRRIVHTVKQMFASSLSRKAFKLKCNPTGVLRVLSHRADSQQGFQLALNWCNTLCKAGLEENTEDSLGELRNLRELKQKPDRQKNRKWEMEMDDQWMDEWMDRYSYCSGLSSGFTFSLTFEDLTCFSIWSISSFWALCEQNKTWRWNLIWFLEVDEMNRLALKTGLRKQAPLIKQFTTDLIVI